MRRSEIIVSKVLSGLTSVPDCLEEFILIYTVGVRDCVTESSNSKATMLLHSEK